ALWHTRRTINPHLASKNRAAAHASANLIAHRQGWRAPIGYHTGGRRSTWWLGQVVCVSAYEAPAERSPGGYHAAGRTAKGTVAYQVEPWLLGLVIMTLMMPG